MLSLYTSKNSFLREHGNFSHADNLDAFLDNLVIFLSSSGLDGYVTIPHLGSRLGSQGFDLRCFSTLLFFWNRNFIFFLSNLLNLFILQSFMDLQFPNGQITYVSGEGLSTSAFLPLCGGLLQAQGQYPGDLKFSFSCKVRWCLMWGSIWHSMISVPFPTLSGVYLRTIFSLIICRINGEHALHRWCIGPTNHLVLGLPRH